MSKTNTKKTPRKKYTYEEYLKFDEDIHRFYEFENGRIIKVAPPSIKHQYIATKLIIIIFDHISKNNLGRVFNQAGINLGENTYIPDIVCFSKKIFLDIEKLVFKSNIPDLIIEIISPKYKKRDRETKFQVYEQFSVKEYWIVDPFKKTIEVFALTDGKYNIYCFVENEGKAKSNLLEGFEVDIKEVLE